MTVIQAQKPSDTFSLSTAWFGFRNMTPANYFSTAAALGIRYVEVPLYSHQLDKWFGRVPVNHVVELASECGVEMVAGVANLYLAAPFDTQGRPLSIEAADTNSIIALRVIDIASDLGLSVIRIAEPAVDSDNQDAAEQYMIDYGTALGPIGDYAQERGIQIALENYGTTIDQMDLMLRVADHANVGTLFDPCNYARMGLDPLEAVRRFKGRISYCHLKDTSSEESRDPDQLFVGSRYRPSLAVGDGDIDWSSLLPELARDYRGFASIEYENDADVVLGTRRSIEFLTEAGYHTPAASLG
ncbi:MAG: hypothetical protein BMS9Abin12_0891 [Acidimicrobiia bacterium]|nr:MAG: hypothetical protein BMS9Abin12_0891 [Acidimicrobiia bacterium]